MGIKNKYHHTFRVSWEQFHRDSRALAWRLLATKKKWKKIIAVSRGGLIPATIIARELNIHYIDTICVSSYTAQHQGELSILKGVLGPDWSGEYLVIDDLVDTGATGKIIRNVIPRVYFATVYAKPDGELVVDTFITGVSQDTWVLFPWDSEVVPNFVEPIVDYTNEIKE
ncbi:xanthine phosphoribosyltransferase [Candidatus Atribacteria bacterium 1244-E10-H5-B2]|nr:MAG: xanthine phosphoribosyltransferase [Candidatus Atribacteria bacterium 1244-E10-H5-B2]